MRYLLDTNTFLWWNIRSSRLSSTAIAICQDATNILWLSMASIWEIQIKNQLGKLKLPAPLDEILAKQYEANGIQQLSIQLPHVLRLSALPDHHKDPFDRMLIAQAQVEGLMLISNDPLIAKYPVMVVW